MRTLASDSSPSDRSFLFLVFFVVVVVVVFFFFFGCARLFVRECACARVNASASYTGVGRFDGKHRGNVHGNDDDQPVPVRRGVVRRATCGLLSGARRTFSAAAHRLRSTQRERHARRSEATSLAPRARHRHGARDRCHVPSGRCHGRWTIAATARQ